MKTDEWLGLEVNKYLKSIGMQTPLTDLVTKTKHHKLKLIEQHVKEILITLGMDLEDDSLIETPQRVSNMFVNEIFSGLLNENFPKCTVVENKMCKGDEFVVEKDITLYSDCEHHLRPIIGKCHVAYIPKDKILGLSKMNRIVQYFARRPQIQERLTHQISHAISFVTDTKDVIVMVDASHTCVSQRGVCDTNSSTATLSALGEFSANNSPLRIEALNAFSRK